MQSHPRRKSVDYTPRSHAAAFIAAGAKHVRVFPLFLGVGKHAREDLPLIMEEIRARHPEVRLELLPTAGESPQLTSLLASIALA